MNHYKKTMSRLPSPIR